MLRWLLGKKRSDELPQYSALRAVPSRGLPAEIVEKEQGEAFAARRAALERDLLEGPERPADDRPLLTAFLNGERTGIMTMTLSEDGAQCVPVFSTPVRAADYLQVLLADGPSLAYLSSTPVEFVAVLRDLESLGITTFALDRCPRCAVVMSVESRSVTTPNDVITIWAVHKATELARAELYLAYALEAARNGMLDAARDVALETLGHVSLEDPDTHLLLGQVAVGLRDRTLILEAKAFLRFFGFRPWEMKLDQIADSGSPDFSGPT